METYMLTAAGVRSPGTVAVELSIWDRFDRYRWPIVGFVGLMWICYIYLIYRIGTRSF